MRTLIILLCILPVSLALNLPSYADGYISNFSRILYDPGGSFFSIEFFAVREVGRLSATVANPLQEYGIYDSTNLYFQYNMSNGSTLWIKTTYLPGMACGGFCGGDPTGRISIWINETSILLNEYFREPCTPFRILKISYSPDNTFEICYNTEISNKAAKAYSKQEYLFPIYNLKYTDPLKPLGERIYNLVQAHQASLHFSCKKYDLSHISGELLGSRKPIIKLLHEVEE